MVAVALSVSYRLYLVWEFRHAVSIHIAVWHVALWRGWKLRYEMFVHIAIGAFEAVRTRYAVNHAACLCFAVILIGYKRLMVHPDHEFAKSDEEASYLRPLCKQRSRKRFLQKARRSKQKKNEKSKVKTCERRATGEEEHDVGIEQAARENATATQASLLTARIEEADAALQAKAEYAACDAQLQTVQSTRTEVICLSSPVA